MYGKILVPVDGSETSTAGLDEAIQLAKRLGSELCLMNGVNELAMDYIYAPGIYADDLYETLRKQGKTVLDTAEATARQQGLKPSRVMIETIGGEAADRILEQAQGWHADLIVMGTHGRRGLSRLAMGSDAELVVRGCHVPVLLIRGHSAVGVSAATAPNAAAAA